jgi:hypothetical protein
VPRFERRWKCRRDEIVVNCFAGPHSAVCRLGAPKCRAVDFAQIADGMMSENVQRMAQYVRHGRAKRE